jgi:Rps23 Pro-64 3,4-dihydroxylase Tpa1-like proline 4-hydroxylase
MINPEINVAAKSLSTVYDNAANYPNIVFDDFVDPTLMTAVSNEAKYLTDNIDQEIWRFGPTDFHDNQVSKRGITEIDKMPAAMAIATTYFNNDSFVNFLRDITGFEDLVPDWSLNGGGFHATYPGGLLGIHHDFNYTDEMGPQRMYRKVNLLIYLNQEWDPSWGGQLELWDSELTGEFKTVELQYNRAVLFNIDDAPHGHPDPLRCPPNESRRSLAFYYYSPTPPDNRLYNRAHWLDGDKLV